MCSTTWAIFPVLVTFVNLISPYNSNNAYPSLTLLPSFFSPLSWFAFLITEKGLWQHFLNEEAPFWQESPVSSPWSLWPSVLRWTCEHFQSCEWLRYPTTSLGYFLWIVVSPLRMFLPVYFTHSVSPCLQVIVEAGGFWSWSDHLRILPEGDWCLCWDCLPGSFAEV